MSLDNSKGVGIFDLIMAPLCASMGIETPGTKHLGLGESNMAKRRSFASQKPAEAGTALVIVPDLTPTPSLTSALQSPHKIIDITPTHEVPALMVTPSATPPLTRTTATSGVAPVGRVSQVVPNAHTEVVMTIITGPGTTLQVFEGLRNTFSCQDAWIAAGIVNEVLSDPTMCLDWRLAKKAFLVLNHLYRHEMFHTMSALLAMPRGKVVMHQLTDDPMYDKKRVSALSYGAEAEKCRDHLLFLTRQLLSALRVMNRWITIENQSQVPNISIDSAKCLSEYMERNAPDFTAIQVFPTGFKARGYVVADDASVTKVETKTETVSITSKDDMHA